MLKFWRRATSKPVVVPDFTITPSDGVQILDMLTCPCCMEIMRDPKVFACGHSLCGSCWDAWKADHHTPSCPTCRTENPAIVPTMTHLVDVLCRSFNTDTTCGTRVNANNQFEHWSSCEKCLEVSMIRERVIQHRLQRKQRMFEKAVVKNQIAQNKWEHACAKELAQRHGREWETGEDSSSYRRFAVARVQVALSKEYATYRPIPTHITEWYDSHRYTHLRRMRLSPNVRSWLDEREQHAELYE